jgi:nucleoside-diphosphate-sugar epimerase
MKRVLLTGAGGYIGQALALVLQRQLQEGSLDSLTLCDLSLPPGDRAPGLSRVEGDLADAQVLDAAVAARPDTVFHLAGITSRLAEERFALGLRANVTASIALFERLRDQQGCPVLVYASSIAVYGPPLPDVIDDDTPRSPALSYGAQKLMVETLLADYARRRWIDARSVRLSTVVARPSQAQVALSSFGSALLRDLAEGRTFECPVGPEATIWFLSLPQCVRNLLHASQVDGQALPAGRAWNLPALRATPAAIVDALAADYGAELASRITYKPQPALQAQFAQWPPLHTAVADRLGMRHDGDLRTLVRRALAPAGTLPDELPTTRGLTR